MRPLPKLPVHPPPRLATVAVSVDLRELRPQQKDHCRIIDPKEQDHERASGAVRRSDVATSNIKSNAGLADDVKHRGKQGPDDDVPPFEFLVRQNFIDRGEEHSGNCKGEANIDEAQQEANAWDGLIDAVPGGR